jgi:hypothetical protein
VDVVAGFWNNYSNHKIIFSENSGIFKAKQKYFEFYKVYRQLANS